MGLALGFCFLVVSLPGVEMTGVSLTCPFIILDTLLASDRNYFPFSSCTYAIPSGQGTHSWLDIWGAADVKAAIAAISCWIENVGWNGPKVSLRDWIVTGHSNGGSTDFRVFF